MSWDIKLHLEFANEFTEWPDQLRGQFNKAAKMLDCMGPQLARPHADHLKASKHANMKELRLDADGGCWRIAFAFNPAREAVILAAGDKSGVKEKRFYKELLRQADTRFDEHLDDHKNKRTPQCVALKIS